ncbi:hypothetical protein QJQ45_015235 [Haematococcus lacustris]|nr:hypothetical protein QJQ45_015235 [Haematococcus lacustris]
MLKQAKAIHLAFDGCTTKRHGKVLVIRVTAAVPKPQGQEEQHGQAAEQGGGQAQQEPGFGKEPVGQGQPGHEGQVEHAGQSCSTAAPRLTTIFTDVLGVIQLASGTAEAHVRVWWPRRTSVYRAALPTMLKIICAVLGAALAAQAAQVPHLQHSQLLDLAEVNPQQAFSVWIAQTSAGRHYAHTPDSEEYRSRFSVWQQNAAYIRKHQASGSSMQLQLNEYADQTWEEFSSKKLGLFGEKALTEKAARISKSNDGFRYASVKAPPSIDWREKNAVTPVKNQGQCGSCWSFATTGAIEGVNAIYTGELVQLSEQQLVDCDTAKDMGCSGGLMDYAYEYVIANGGIDTEEDYMYWSSWGMSFWTCNRKKESRRTAVTIDGYEDVPTDEGSLLKAASKQPISVGICASSAMQFYSGGVIDSCCDELNHGVLVVGYGNDEKTGAPYWLIKNSWGGAWGEQGFFRLKRDVGETGLCGIATAASYPIKSTPNHPVPQMCDIFGWTSCSATSTCSCQYSFLGLFCVCDGVGCDDNKHCCPGNAPKCDVQRGVCVSEDGLLTVPWTDKTKAETLMSAAVATPSAPQLFVDNKAEPGPEMLLAPGTTAAASIRPGSADPKLQGRAHIGRPVLHSYPESNAFYKLSVTY